MSVCQWHWRRTHTRTLTRQTKNHKHSFWLISFTLPSAHAFPSIQVIRSLLFHAALNRNTGQISHRRKAVVECLKWDESSSFSEWLNVRFNKRRLFWMSFAFLACGSPSCLMCVCVCGVMYESLACMFCEDFMVRYCLKGVINFHNINIRNGPKTKL